MTMQTDREICASANQSLSADFYDASDAVFADRFDPQQVMQMLDRQEQLESKLKEASDFIQKLGPTIDYDIVAEIEEMLK